MGPWLTLVAAGLFEVGFTTCLRYADGFRNMAWTAGLAAYAVSKGSGWESAPRHVCASVNLR